MKEVITTNVIIIIE